MPHRCPIGLVFQQTTEFPPLKDLTRGSIFKKYERDAGSGQRKYEILETIIDGVVLATEDTNVRVDIRQILVDTIAQKTAKSVKIDE